MDLSADAPDLSGVATDGSMALWVDASSGRQWSKITAVDNGTKIVTVETAYAVTEANRNWGIGGKRATLAASLQLFKDVLAGWIVDIEDNGSTYVLTAAIVCNVAASTAVITVRSSSATRPTITSATNSVVLFNISTATNWIFENLKLTHTAATRGQGFTPVSANCTDITIRNCVIDGCSKGIEADNITNFQVQRLHVSGCEILNCTNDGAQINAGTTFTDCYIHDNTGDGIQYSGNAGTAGNTGVMLFGCVLADNGGQGLHCSAANTPLIINRCSFVNNTGSGIKTGTSNSYSVTIRDCIFWSNGAYGLEMGSQAIASYDTDYNAYGDNTTAARLTFTAGSHDITLTVDPFDSATDYGLNNTSGGGADLKRVASQAPNVTDNPAGDIGGVPTGGGVAASSGGGGGRRIGSRRRY